MKLIIFMCVAVCTVTYQDAARPDLRAIKMNVNLEADKFLRKLGGFMQLNGLDPYPLTNIRKEISYRPFLINYGGSLDLTDGSVQDISKMRRDGDVILTVGEKAVVQLPITYEELNFKYHYVLKIMGLGPGGVASGTVYNPQVRLVAEADLKTFEITLLSFEVVSPGRVTMNYSGHILFDWFISLMTNTMTLIFRSEILRVFLSLVKGQVEDYIKNVNKYTAANPEKTAEFVKKNLYGIL